MASSWRASAHALSREPLAGSRDLQRVPAGGFDQPESLPNIHTPTLEQRYDKHWQVCPKNANVR